MPLAPGQAFGRYVIEARLGGGGCGDVYRARDTVLHRQVALKVLLPDDAERQHGDARARILREATAAAALDHPHAVSIFDVGEVDGVPYLAMEHIVGRSLRDHIGDATVPFERRVRWLSDVALALAAAHARGLVHRDVKPENVMVRDDGFVKVVDFGIARSTSVTPTGPTVAEALPTSVSGKGLSAGTPIYMAPEQVRGEPLDGRTDQFGWAVMAYELLAGGVLPWDPSGGVLKYVAHVLTDDPIPLRDRDPRVPIEVASVVHRALLRSAADRFPSMEAIAHGLDGHRSRSSTDVTSPAPHAQARHAAALVTTASPLGATQPALPEERPALPRRRAALMALLGVALVGGLSFAIRRAGSAPPERPVAPSASASTQAPLPADQGQVQIVILGIENRTAEPSFDGTLDLLLSSALLQSRRVYPYAGTKVRALTEELEGERRGPDERVGAELLARDGGRVLTVRGVVAPQGAAYTISLVVLDANANASARTPVASPSMDRISAAHVVPTIGRLACAVRAAIGDACAADVVERTDLSLSVDADREFTVAMALGDAGDRLGATSHLERAVELDPSFARGHHSLAVCYDNVGRSADGDREFAAALRGVDQLGDFDRLKLLGDLYSKTYELDRAASSYQELLRIWPQDKGAAGNLVGAYTLKGDLTGALDLERTIVAKHPKSVNDRTNLVQLYILTGDPEEGARRADALVAELPHPGEVTFVYGAVADFLLGRHSDAIARYTRLQAIAPSLAAAGLADLAMAERRWADAATILEAGIADDVAHKNDGGAATKWATLARVRLARGDKTGAIAAADKAVAAGGLTEIYAAGAVYAELGLEKKTRPLTDKLGTSLALQSRIQGKFIEAELLRGAGKAKEAIAKLEDAQHIQDSWLGRFHLGRASLDAGDAARAEREMRTCLKRRGEGAFVYLDDSPSLQYLTPVYYYLARAEDAQASADAPAAYRAFLALHPDGPGTAAADALVDDARRRLGSRP
jgi:serine/threonine-protein kinase